MTLWEAQLWEATPEQLKELRDVHGKWYLAHRNDIEQIRAELRAGKITNADARTLILSLEAGLARIRRRIKALSAELTSRLAVERRKNGIPGIPFAIKASTDRTTGGDEGDRRCAAGPRKAAPGDSRAD
jgi:hypothetical protein